MNGKNELSNIVYQIIKTCVEYFFVNKIMPKDIWILAIKGMNDGKSLFRHVLTRYNSKLPLLEKFIESSFLLS